MKFDIVNALLYSAIMFFVHFLFTRISNCFETSHQALQDSYSAANDMPDWDLLQEIASCNFDTTLQTGTKEKSIVYGQLYDYLRYPDLHAKASASLYHSKYFAENNFYLHIHFSDNLNTSQKILEDFKNMSMYIKIVKPDIKLADKYIELDSKNNNGFMIIENSYMLVKNSIYLSIFIDPNSDLTSKRYCSSIALDISIKNASIGNKLFSDIKILTENSYYSISSTIFIVIFMIIYCCMIFNTTNAYLQSWNIYPVYSDKLVLLLLSPIAFYISQFELSILREVCPLNINVLLYLFANVFVFILSCILTFGILPKFDFVPRNLIQRYNLMYAIFQLNFFIVLFVIQWILPESWKPAFSCLSIKVFYCLFAPFFIANILFNILMKQKSLRFERHLVIILPDLFLFCVLRSPLECLFNSLRESAVVQSSILFTAAYIFSWLQLEYGSRFFLPNCCRKKAHEYRRRIVEEFDLTKIESSQWPECYICLEKLHHQSFLRGQRSLAKLEGNQCYEMFLKTMDGRNVHYFCYLWTIDNGYHNNPEFYDIDKYDD